MFAPMVPETSVLFVSEASITTGATASYGLKKRVVAVKGCRSVGKKDMKFNDATPKMKVDPERYTVEADGQICTAEPATELPLTQNWYVY
jgi:urease